MTITIGTEKQIAWATEIKADLSAKWEANYVELTEAWEDADKSANLRKIIDMAMTCEDSSAWIDARNAGPRTVIFGMGFGMPKAAEMLGIGFGEYKKLSDAVA